MNLFLYLLMSISLHASDRTEDAEYWKPQKGMTWAIQYTGQFKEIEGVQIYNLDLFDNSVKRFSSLKEKGAKIICYFSAGSIEDWRPDVGDFPAEIIGKPVKGWAGENWVDIREIKTLRKLIGVRLDLAVEKGCDAVDPDNMDAYQHETGFELTAEHQLAFNKMVAKEAHERGLAVGLKNDLLQIEELVKYFDFAVNEQCFAFNECHYLLPFIENNKPVFGIEYSVKKADFCPKSKELGFETIKKRLLLDSFVETCD